MLNIIKFEPYIVQLQEGAILTNIKIQKSYLSINQGIDVVINPKLKPIL